MSEHSFALKKPNKECNKYSEQALMNAKCTSTMMLSFGNSALAETGKLVDADGISEQLWLELGRIYKMSSTLSVASLQAKLDSLHL